MDTSALTGSLFTWLRGGVFLAVVFVILILAGVAYLYLRRYMKLQYPVLEFIELGAGKYGVLKTKAGWFKSKTILFGLFDHSGELILKTKKGRIILNASTSDFHEIGKKRGLFVKRKGDDPRILAPLSKLSVVNDHLLAEIAPASFRDASVRLIKQAEVETSGFMDKYGQFLMFGGTILFAFISIILIVQMVKNGQDKAAELIIQAGDITIKALASSAP